jgi:hypothetical protein
MAHYAEVDENNIVIRVVVADDVEFLTDLFGGTWIQTSYNTRGGVHYTQEMGDDGKYIPSDDQSKALRYNFAGPGYTYDPDKDAFIAPQPSDDAVLNETTLLWERDYV